ncbi:MAG: nucleotide exchange factor GrpE [SAR324 cluster bacterium]|nr:nucleotide exchange factor GrpE [SAR324 cluster bacterium]
MVNKKQTESKANHSNDKAKEENASVEIDVSELTDADEETLAESPEEPEEVEAESADETGEQTAAGPEEPDVEKTPEDEQEEPTLEEQLEQSQKKVTDLQDRLLRMNAEFENYKKRMAKENVDKFKYYHMGLIKELLPALDSLEQAIEHGKKENATIEAILEGIQMVYKLNQEAFEKFSISKIQAVGEPFDPAFHQAVGTVESETIPEDHVADQFQVGYLLHDRVVRPAMVRVSKKQ